ncbi:TPA: hypothetical protein EYP66_05640 [Candidatus Poribacteria bacterium]|nr:hypothetical protein [Candidatus Poribacteria bacterium]
MTRSITMRTTAEGLRMEAKPRAADDGTAKELIIDFKIKLSPKARDAHFKKSLYGVLATRVAKHISVLDGGGRIQNSEGGINEKEIHSNRAKWCDYSGPITCQEWNGLAVFDHPDNPSYPTYWIVRDDGWMCPGVFYASPTTVKKGEEIVIKHRVYVHKEDAEEGNVAERHNEYISHPKMTITR